MPVAHQVAIIYASTQGYLDHVPLDKVHDFEQQYLATLMREHSEILDRITAGSFDDKAKKVLDKQAIELARSYNKSV